VHNHIERRSRHFIFIIVCFIFQLAPSLPLQEDFVYHWKAITHYYIETSGKRSPAVIVNVLYYQITTHHLLFMFCRWQSPSDRHQHSLPSGADAGYPDPGGEGERVGRDGTLYGVSSPPQDPGDALHTRQSRCQCFS